MSTPSHPQHREPASHSMGEFAAALLMIMLSILVFWA